MSERENGQLPQKKQMPQGQQHKVDRESVRLLAIEFGVREAARRCGLNQNTVISWSKRDGWFKENKLPPTHNRSRATAISAIKSGDILLEQLQEDEQATKLGLSKATRSAAAHLSELPGACVTKQHHALRNVSAAAATLYRWRENTQAGDMNISLSQLHGQLCFVV